MSLVSRPMIVEEDQLGVLQLFADVFGHLVEPEMWRWKYRPPWTDRHSCWVFRDGEKVIGYVGAVELRGLAEGREIPFFQLADAMVHPDYRRKHDYFGLGTRLIVEDLVASHPERIIYGFTNHIAFLWLKRCGVSDLIEKACLHTFKPSGDEADCELEEWSFDDEKGLDGFWNLNRAAFATGLIRDAAYLRWRYQGHPFYNYKLLAVKRGAETIGWAVVGQSPHGQPLPVIDLYVPNAEREPVLRRLATHFDRNVAVWLPESLAPEADEKRETKTNVYLFAKDSTYSADQLRSSLYYTMGDTDWC